MLQKLIQKYYSYGFKRTEKITGVSIKFHHIPHRFINGWVTRDMTPTWKKFGLDIVSGANYFTMGHMVGGDSSRFNPESPEYQAWLGAYAVRLAHPQKWNIRDHFNLAVADQNSWLGLYGDKHPLTTTKGWEPEHFGKINLGRWIGDLYEFGCTTHSDVGPSTHSSIKVFFASLIMVSLYKLSNPKLKIPIKALQPLARNPKFEKLRLKGYIAVFDIKENVKVVFYGNGAIVHDAHGTTDTFEILKSDLLSAIESAEIVLK